MPFTITIPLTDTFFDEVEDAFIDKPQTAQEFIFGMIKGMCKDAKAGKLNRTCSVNIIENGQVKQEFAKLNEINLAEFTLESDPNWLPKDLDKTSVRKWEHKVTDKTMEYIRMYCQFVGLRFKRYNESILKEAQARGDKLKKELTTAPETLPSPPDPKGARATKEMIQKQIETETKLLKDQTKKAEASVPKNIEEAIYGQVYPKLHKTVMDNLDQEFDKEFQQMYPPKKTPPTTQPARTIPGSRPS